MTKHDENQRQSISDRQSQAIDLLLAGESLTSVGASLGVSRQTISGWLNHHAPFIAELNHRRHQNRLAMKSRYEQAVGLALDVVIDSLKEGDQRLAVAILKSAGRQLAESSSGPAPQSTSGVILSLAHQRESESLRSFTISQSQVEKIEDESNSQSDLAVTGENTGMT